MAVGLYDEDVWWPLALRPEASVQDDLEDWKARVAAAAEVYDPLAVAEITLTINDGMILAAAKKALAVPDAGYAATNVEPAP